MSNDHPCKTAKYKCDECKKKEISPIPKEILIKAFSNGLENITMKNNKQISIKDLLTDSPLKSSRHRRGQSSVVTVSILDETVDDLDMTMTPRNLQLVGIGGDEVDLAAKLNKLGKADTFLIKSNPQY